MSYWTLMMISKSVMWLIVAFVCVRMKLDFRKAKGMLAVFLGIFCTGMAFDLIAKKYDFRGEWDAYQFRKTMIDADAFQKPIEPPAELGN